MQLSIRDGLRIVGLVGPRRNRTAALSTSEVASSSRAVMRGSSPCPGYEVSILRRGCFRFTRSEPKPFPRVCAREGDLAMLEALSIALLHYPAACPPAAGDAAHYPCPPICRTRSLHFEVADHDRSSS